MLETILRHLHNWFPVRGAARTGSYAIVSGTLTLDFLQYGQYFRIEGSVFNDGLHAYPCSDLTDEAFFGTITPLAIPRDVQALAEEIADWREKNPETDKVSESFGGYSYTRPWSAEGTSGWETVFRARLNPYRKVG